jgi:hypothetical protein
VKPTRRCATPWLFLLALVCALPVRAQEVPLDWYTVPALSATPRLPDQVPADGDRLAPVRFIAAQGEFEPASVILAAPRDYPAVTATAGELNGPAGTIPAASLDIRVVKCWYQAGTAWSSYFADRQGKRLTPELLLYDENLIRVDPTTRDNYLRVDDPAGPRYLWVSYPRRAATATFNHDLAPVADAATLQPFSLTAHRGKQLWLTLHVPPAARPGLYTGGIFLTAAGAPLATIPLQVRVLPFALPEPKTWYDLDRDFYAILYNHNSLPAHVALNGGDTALAERKLRAIMANWRDHNALSPLVDGGNGRRPELLARQLAMMQEIGLRTRPVFGVINVFAPYNYLAKGNNQTDHPDFREFTARFDLLLKTFHDTLGHRDLFAMAWDEPGRQTLLGQRSSWRYAHDQGIQVAGTSKPWHFELAPYNEDFSNYGGFIHEQAASVRQWHAVGGRVGNYAGPHTGPENPDYIRRSHGLLLYKLDLDATFNYIFYEGPVNIWNDFDGEYQYRCFNLAYPTRDGLIDTLAWEGFREALDDIRYATLLQQLARRAIAAGPIELRYAGKQALAVLAAADATHDDLDALRLELITHILALHDALGGAR